MKVNAQVYCDQILQARVVPWAREHFKENQWTFQQDSAPAYKARIRQQFCKGNFSDFWGPDL